MRFFPHNEFDRIAAIHRGDKNVRRLSYFDQFTAFAQLSFRESLRDIQACLPYRFVHSCTMLVFERR